MTDVPLVLVDMDGVLVDFGALLRSSLSEQGWHLDPHEHTVMYVEHVYGERFGPEAGAAALAAVDRPGAYADPEPIVGAAEGLAALEARGLDVAICTSPQLTNPTCASDKLAWVEAHLGSDWARRTVITKDKTLVHGAVLIDDKPTIRGRRTPSWRHVVFDAPWNQRVDADVPRLASWADADGLDRVAALAHRHARGTAA